MPPPLAPPLLAALPRAPLGGAVLLLERVQGTEQRKTPPDGDQGAGPFRSRRSWRNALREFYHQVCEEQSPDL
jgi:hypothetical protein